MQESLEVTRELLDRYDRPGPRYTSYPTAPEWSHEFGEADYLRALANAAERADEPLSIYVHLPFCWERCHFCGCNVVISKHPEVSEKYLQYVYKEIGMVARRLGNRKTVKQLHWGGGTPTYQSVEQIKALHGVLAREFEFAPDAEIALEVDPRVTSSEQLETLRALGFNRISMGVQDLDPKVQATINRNQTEAQTRALFGKCRELGFEGINIDLIYGLPDQTPEGWTRTVEAVIDIRPDRLAVYSYAHLPDQIKHQRKMDDHLRPTGAEKYDLFAIARRLFVAAGYRIIGMDHFALPTDELAVALDERRLHRNFMGYTVVPAEDMVAFGVSGIGEVGGAYAQNEKRPAMYYKALDADTLPVLCGTWLTEDDQVRRWVIRQLMCNFYLSFQALSERFGVDYDAYFADEESRLQEFYQEQFLAREGDSIRVLPLGQAFIRNVAMVFDAHLKKPAHFTKFSRTI
ncbi:MAG: oxygen-independent coproporphyrinogen III oxidase [Candidatus Hydrogenedentes bacterium]|nr:oxygen-independent coproporphyrinogen III oxidase [Candidatus Hydrogenedentota bacterium]